MDGTYVVRILAFSIVFFSFNCRHHTSIFSSFPENVLGQRALVKRRGFAMSNRTEDLTREEDRIQTDHGDVLKFVVMAPVLAIVAQNTRIR